MQEIFKLRYQVYCKECRFIKEEDYPEGLERDRYDPHSLHFVAEDVRGVIGTTRLILDNSLGFPFEEHCKNNIAFEMAAVRRKHIAEISRLAISKNYRRRKDDGLYYAPEHKDASDEGESAKEGLKRLKPMAFGLYREIYQECKRRKITHCFALMEKPLWILLRMHHFLFRQIGEEIDFYGPVRPYVCPVEEAENTLFRRSPQTLEYLLDGLESEYRPRFFQDIL